MSLNELITRIKKCIKIGIALIAIFFAATEHGSAKNYYVNAETGNNAYNGQSVDKSKKTLAWFSWSTTFLQPGDTVFVMNGTYTGGNQFAILALRASGSREKPLVITNYPGHKPLLKLNEYKWAGVHIADGAHDIVINGLTIQGYNQNISLEDALNQPGSCANPNGSVDPKYNANGIALEGRNNGHVHHITVSNCEIFECGGGGTGSTEADYLTFENNLVYNNCWYTVYGNSGISNLNSWNFDDHSETEYSMIIRNNILFGNQLFVPWIGPCKIYDGNGIIIDSEYNEDKSFPAYSGKTLIKNNVVYGNGGRGIHVYKSANVDIINNTSYFNCKSPEISDGEITVQNASDIRVFNNIIYARDGQNANLRLQAPTNVTFGNNLIYNASSSKIGFTNETDIVGRDPEFVDPDLSDPDLRLKEASPARNAGTKAEGLYSETDINGISRFSGGVPDIGAYEFEEEIISNAIVLPGKLNIRIYPNPAKDKIMLDLSGKSIHSSLNYSLVNLTGKLVLAGEFNETDALHSIDIQHLKEGMYFLKVWNNKNSVVENIIIKR